MDERVGLDDAARGRQQEGEGVIGGGVGEDVRGVRDQDAPGGGGGDVYVVESHGDIGEDLHTVQAGDACGVEVIGELAHDSPACL